jgi:hypothetical protein
MKSTRAGRRGPVKTEKGRLLAVHGLTVLLGALFMTWPAFYNGFPLLYPDSMTYLDDGRKVARAIFLHKYSGYYGMRSFIYSLGILPWHWNITPWPIVALQCMLVAFVLWLVARAILPRHAIVIYLILVSLLSLFTSVSWYSCLVLPDILGPLVYLSFYLLVFARETLSRWERIALYLIAWWGITAHSTHFMLAAGMCLLLPVMLVFERKPVGRILQSTGEVVLVVLLAAAAQLALHGFLYGQPSLNGDRPPYLMARIIADGPGRWYLEKNCGQLKWTICGHVHNLPDDPDNFLWAPDGIWETASDIERAQMLREEVPFVLATLRAYPSQQISRSAGNVWAQLNNFGLYDLDASAWVLEVFDQVMPAAQSSYQRGRQARNAVPLELISDIQYWTVIASLGAMVAFLPLGWRRRSARLVELSVVIGFMVIANGFVTGALSMPDDRYECRVIWLVPLLAGLFVSDWLCKRQTPDGRPGQPPNPLPLQPRPIDQL